MKSIVPLALALALSGCAPTTPLFTGQVPAEPETSVLLLDFVAQNLPRNLAGQILPLEMLLIEVDPATGQRKSPQTWSLGVCRADWLGCETGEIKTLRLELPPGTYAIGYLGTHQLAAPWYALMGFERAGNGGDVVIGGLTVAPDFSGAAQATPLTPMITVRANEIGYAGVLRAVYSADALMTSFTAAPERRAALVAQIGTALADRPGYYR